METVFKSKLFVVFEILVLLVVVGAFIRITTKQRTIQEEIAYLEENVAREQRENQGLRERLAGTSFDSYVELQAKRKLNYKKPGETVFVFYEESPEQASFVRPYPGVLSQKSMSNPAKWWHYFFN